MAYWRLFYHLVWGTKNREDLLSSAIEEELKTHLAEKTKWSVHQVGRTFASHARGSSLGLKRPSPVNWAETKPSRSASGPSPLQRASFSQPAALAAGKGAANLADGPLRRSAASFTL